MAKQGLEPDIWLEDSALFLSDRHPDTALRRWFEDCLPRMRQTVDFLNGLNTLVRLSPALESVVAVAAIHKVGSDWVMIDYDVTSVPVAACDDALMCEVRRRCSEELRTKAAGDWRLEMLDAMVRSNSSSLHWSVSKQKLLVVGAAADSDSATPAADQ